jgi:hypothetical protein
MEERKELLMDVLMVAKKVALKVERKVDLSTV